ncbi:MAG TPA: response regulator [Anaerolineae bacterium]|nr:response regulator [Anaerolineae bacterium]HQI84585.1 response regulator [Anaerolineae bacterium]
MALQTAHADILIVDDTPDNLRLLTQILTLKGYKVRAVSSGEQALIAATTAPPDLILLDIMMPGMDGYTVCERLKARPETTKIPVIFVSALNEALDKVKAFAAGGVDYLTKPFQVEEVLARVGVHLTLRALQIQLEEANAQLAAQNAELQQRNAELEEALSAIKTLSGLVPICAWCGRKIQDTQGNWIKVENYIEAHSQATFTHGICPDCLEKWKS